MDAASLEDTSRTDLLGTRLLHLREQGLLCDVNLLCRDGTLVKAHSAVLAATSKFFRAVLVGPWSSSADESQPFLVKLDHTDRDAVEICVKALYTSNKQAIIELLPSRLRSTVRNVDFCGLESILQLLNFLDAAPTQRLVEQAVLTPVESTERDEHKSTVLSNLFPLWRLAVQTHSCLLQHEMERVAEMQMWWLLQSPERTQLQCMPFETLLKLLRPANSWHDTVKALLLWASGDTQERTMQLFDWCSDRLACQPTGCICPFTPKVVLEVLEGFEARDVKSVADPEGATSMLKDLRASALVTCRQSGGRPPLGQPTSLLVCGGRSGDWLAVQSSERFDVAAGCWSAARELNSKSAFSLGVDVPEGMLVVSGLQNQACSIYSSATNSWRSKERSSVPHLGRLHASIARIDDLVYLSGGKIDGSGQAVAAVDAFSATGSHSWSSCLCAPRSCHGSAAICGKLYVVGGQPHLFRRTEWLDHYTDRWLESPLLMCDERKYLGLTAHEGRLVAVGGMTSKRVRLSSVEAFDPRDRRGWLRLPYMSTARSSAGVASLSGKIYVVGGSDVHDQPLASVEAFDFTAGRWMALPPLQIARTGHAVAVV